MANQKVSAGLLVYRFKNDELQVLLAHNGGPFFANKDEGYWTIPKGLLEASEDGLAAAKREFKEETSLQAPAGNYLKLGTTTQANGKVVHAWAVEANLDPALMHSNIIDIEWPPHSGKYIKIPEVDRLDWFDVDQAKVKANKAQVVFLDRLVDELSKQTNS